VDLKQVTTAADIVTASVIKGLLESAGIPVLMRSSGSAGWLFPGTPGGGGSVDVLVPAECLAEAQELIAEAEKGGRAPE
jgi:Putative prokaryotic signal transducing protein